jgi:hypothetical protein
MTAYLLKIKLSLMLKIFIHPLARPSRTRQRMGCALWNQKLGRRAERKQEVLTSAPCRLR